MINTFKEKLHSKRLKEAGGTLTTFILLFPVIFSVFGLALDFSLATSTKTALQGAMDTATQVTLSQAKNPTTANVANARPQLNKDQAYQTLTRYYGLNRIGNGGNAKTPFLICQTSLAPEGTRLVNGGTNCNWSEMSFSFTDTGRQLDIKYTVREQSATIFLSFLNIEKLTYTIQSSAQTGFSYEQG